MFTAFTKLVGNFKDYDRFVDLVFIPMHFGLSLALGYSFMQFDNWYLGDWAVPSVAFVILSVVVALIDILRLRECEPKKFLRVIKNEYGVSLVFMLGFLWFMTIPVMQVVPLMMAKSQIINSGMTLLLVCLLVLPVIRFLLFYRTKGSDEDKS